MITAIEAVMLALACLILGGMIGVIAMALASAPMEGCSLHTGADHNDVGASHG